MSARRLVGPIFSVAAVSIGVALRWLTWSPMDIAQLAGAAWLIGTGLLVAALVSRPSAQGSWAVALLLLYAGVLVVTQPSIRTDGNAEAAVIATVVWLIPAAAGGVALPRIRQWAAAAGCWCLLLALSAAAAGTVSHRSASIGLFGVVWD